MQVVEKHDTIRVSALNDRHDSIVYVYRNDTVLIDRWHKRTQIDTIYQNKIEYVHDTVNVMKTEVRKSDDKWTLKDELNTLLMCIGISSIVLLIAKWRFDKKQ